MNVFTPERVTLDMPRATYEYLLIALGYYTGAIHASFGDPAVYRALALANELNEGNPDWTPYAIPEEPPMPCFTYKPSEETP